MMKQKITWIEDFLIFWKGFDEIIAITEENVVFVFFCLEFDNLKVDDLLVWVRLC